MIVPDLVEAITKLIARTSFDGLLGVHQRKPDWLRSDPANNKQARLPVPHFDY